MLKNTVSLKSILGSLNCKFMHDLYTCSYLSADVSVYIYYIASTEKVT